jgi:hypothetical protein
MKIAWRFVLRLMSNETMKTAKQPSEEQDAKIHK